MFGFHNVLRSQTSCLRVPQSHTPNLSFPSSQRSLRKTMPLVGCPEGRLGEDHRVAAFAGLEQASSLPPTGLERRCTGYCRAMSLLLALAGHSLTMTGGLLVVVLCASLSRARLSFSSAPQCAKEHVCLL